MIVVADTSPINYLLLINQLDLLPHLFQPIIIPDTVRPSAASILENRQRLPWLKTYQQICWLSMNAWDDELFKRC
ncbi:MAG: hypothetical protein NW224_06990 [Leptolyngbyaceae cyanobacterium bins.302]|nr:hypothetical protein [Leptolyngbyaceae cyanobacterium bins.302]